MSGFSLMPVLSFFQSRAKSFRYAFAGWWYVIRTQKNAWIHALVSVVVIVLSLWLRLAPHDWAVILLAIGMVWTAEGGGRFGKSHPALSGSSGQGCGRSSRVDRGSGLHPDWPAHPGASFMGEDPLVNFNGRILA